MSRRKNASIFNVNGVWLTVSPQNFHPRQNWWLNIDVKRNRLKFFVLIKFRFEFCLFIYFSFLKIPAIVMTDSIADAMWKVTIAASSALDHISSVERSLIDIGQDRSHYRIHIVSLAGVRVFLCVISKGSESEFTRARSRIPFFCLLIFLVHFTRGPFIPLERYYLCMKLFYLFIFFIRLLLFLSSLDHDFHLLLLFLYRMHTPYLHVQSNSAKLHGCWSAVSRLFHRSMPFFES